jgi:hypothetical protein
MKQKEEEEEAWTCPTSNSQVLETNMNEWKKAKSPKF